ncbi:MAG: hypothetical protein GY797_18495 [Deltaproteobacteria bacterium]|nr:hypothetical protein [Deltaproteobacteria bacterium]
MATKEQEHTLKSEIKAALRKMGNVDLRRMAVIIIGPLDDDKIESLNVVVPPFRLDAEKADRDQLVKSVTQHYRQIGITPTNIVTAVTKYNRNRAISIQFDVPTSTEIVHMWQVFVPGKIQTYIVTSTYGASEWKKYEPIFQSMLNSINIDIKNTR